jgi:hypothetical protein
MARPPATFWPVNITVLQPTRLPRAPGHTLYGMIFQWSVRVDDRIRSIVVRVSSYRSRDPGFDSRSYQIFWEIVGPERVPLSLVSITGELLKWKSSGSGSRKSRLTAWGRLRWPRDTLYPQKLAVTSLTSGGRSVGLLRLRAKAKEFSFSVHVDPC